MLSAIFSVKNADIEIGALNTEIKCSSMGCTIFLIVG